MSAWTEHVRDVVRQHVDEQVIVTQQGRAIVGRFALPGSIAAWIDGEVRIDFEDVRSIQANGRELLDPAQLKDESLRRQRLAEAENIARLAEAYMHGDLNGGSFHAQAARIAEAAARLVAYTPDDRKA